jgi:hypothetical protein
VSSSRAGGVRLRSAAFGMGTVLEGHGGVHMCVCMGVCGRWCDVCGLCSVFGVESVSVVLQGPALCAHTLSHKD